MSQDNPFERDEVHDLLELWAEFMKRDSNSLSWRRRDPILQSESSLASEQLYDQADTRLANTVAAVVDSIPIHQQAALFKRFGLAVVFRFPRLVYEDTLSDAVRAVRLLCAKRGLLSAQYRCRIAPNGDLCRPKKREARMTV